MGEPLPVRPVLRLVAVTAGSAAAIEWVCHRAAPRWGTIALRSPFFEFNQTSFYELEMGTHLSKQLLAFTPLMDPAELPDAKRLSNAWEREYAQTVGGPVARPVNIDPGYLTEAKLVLASTKDRDHRIYLRDGIYAEITLYYQQRKWRTSRWTYPDFQQQSYFDFLTLCRDFLRRQFVEQR